MSKLERKFGRYAIHNLMYYIIILYAVGFVFQMINPSFYYNYLSLDAAAILHGQIWRIVTFIIQPPSSSLLFIIIVLYFITCWDPISERIWGAFSLMYISFSGMLFHVIAAIIVYLLTGLSLPLNQLSESVAVFAFAACIQILSSCCSF